MFWGLWILPSANKAITGIIHHSSSVPMGALFPNGTVIQLRSCFLSAPAAAVISRNFNEAIFFPPDRERALRPITAQLNRWGDTSFRCSLVFIVSNDMVCFFNQAFYCSSLQRLLQLRTGRFIQQPGKRVRKWMCVFQVKGNIFIHGKTSWAHCV